MFSFDRFEIEGDKANHFVYGCLATAVVLVLTGSFFLAVAFCSVLAVAKEMYDSRWGSGFDWMDIVWTLLGGAVAIAVRLL